MPLHKAQAGPPQQPLFSDPQEAHDVQSGTPCTRECLCARECLRARVRSKCERHIQLSLEVRDKFESNRNLISKVKELAEHDDKKPETSQLRIISQSRRCLLQPCTCRAIFE